ncbi:PREDICTED: trehalase-like [Wasmannia auropunctata]|uniref:trehalase-like n=1 Tax=Wasmannia auropunctata TaxID=64793 RepID=UPI0005EEE09A|nr:PREDICTED: trehalase-like [Wasmannia auropunctata]
MIAAIFVIFLALDLSDAASIAHVTRHHAASSGPADLCDSQVYCDGPLLHTVQLAGIFNDSKTFVDLYQLHDPNVTVENFNALMNATNNSPNRTEIAAFVAENFAMQDELENTTLPDWKEKPPILKSINDPQYQEWAKRLNYIWKTLARKINDNLVINPQRHSLIYVNNTFVIPGGRFKGDCQRVAKYYDYTHDEKFLKKNIALLEKEFEYWQNKKTVNVKKNGRTYRMAHYVVNSRGPRPESYKEDYQLAQQVPEQKRGALYNNLKAAAESGWDFSYRWSIGTNKGAKLSLVNASTSDIIPVDLNAMLQRNAKMLAYFHFVLGNTKKLQHYNKIASDYQTAIDNVLWNENEGTWLDYDTRNKRSRNTFYPSNLTPLYTMSYNLEKRIKYALRTISYLKKNKIDSYFGGTPTSMNYTGEQWDFPNAWPPLQSFLILGLQQTKVKEAVDLAETLADRWLRSNYLGYDEYGKMFEKYNAIHPGEGGGGGEYNVQEGFGWTNGIVFELLRLFPNAKSTDDIGYDDGNSIDR